MTTQFLHSQPTPAASIGLVGLDTCAAKGARKPEFRSYSYSSSVGIVGLFAGLGSNAEVVDTDAQGWSPNQDRVATQ